jgi:hypothetical protein
VSRRSTAAVFMNSLLIQLEQGLPATRDSHSPEASERNRENPAPLPALVVEFLPLQLETLMRDLTRQRSRTSEDTKFSSSSPIL